MLSELLGELNASHTGCRYAPRRYGGDETAALGVFTDQSFAGPGLKVDEIIEKSPLNVSKSKIAPGMIIEKIDGVPIAPGADWCPLLNHKAGRPTLLSVFDPAKNARFDETVKPISIHDEEELLYQALGQVAPRVDGKTLRRTDRLRPRTGDGRRELP